jgi:ABC-type transport system substrate-binding protein
LSRVAQAIQAQLAEVGVRVELVERDASSQREAARQGETDMVVLDWWADYPDADNFLYPLFYSGSFGPGGNYAFYADPVTDSLILRARRTTDDGARTALYRRIDERVYRAAPWLYLWPRSPGCEPNCISTTPCRRSSGVICGACCAAIWAAPTSPSGPSPGTWQSGSPRPSSSRSPR